MLGLYFYVGGFLPVWVSKVLTPPPQLQMAISDKPHEAQSPQMFS